MNGYRLRENSTGDNLENDLVKNAFYISFTGDNLCKGDEDYMWNYFAKKTGVRLVFEVSNINTHLRQIYYSNYIQKGITLLKDLVEIADNYGKCLIINGISTIGFFYLPFHLNIERECRLLVKRTEANCYNMEFGVKDDYEYVKLPLNKENSLGAFKLKKVILGPDTDIDKVKKILNSSLEFQNVYTQS